MWNSTLGIRNDATYSARAFTTEYASAELWRHQQKNWCSTTQVYIPSYKCTILVLSENLLTSNFHYLYSYTVCVRYMKPTTRIFSVRRYIYISICDVKFHSRDSNPRYLFSSRTYNRVCIHWAMETSTKIDVPRPRSTYPAIYALF